MYKIIKLITNISYTTVSNLFYFTSKNRITFAASTKMLFKYKNVVVKNLKSFIISFQTIIKGSQYMYYMYADLTFLKALILEIHVVYTCTCI